MEKKPFLEEVVNALKEKTAYFDDFEEMKTRSEGWVETEIVRHFRKINSNMEITNVKDASNDHLNEGRKLRPDFKFADGTVVELKQAVLLDDDKKSDFATHLKKLRENKDLANVSKFGPNFWLLWIIYPDSEVKEEEKSNFFKELENRQPALHVSEEQVKFAGGKNALLWLVSKK